MLYDSGYAANMVAGRWQPNTNTNVVQWARGLLAEVEKSRTVHWVHVKGHSGDGGNDRADQLVQWGKEIANLGLQLEKIVRLVARKGSIT